MGYETWWSPANLTNRSPILRTVSAMFNRQGAGVVQPPPNSTSEIGAAGTASPSTFQFELQSLRYDRPGIITDVRKLLSDDGRANRSNTKFAREATRKGLLVDVQPKDGVAQSVADQAKTIIDQVNKTCKVPSKLLGWAKMLPAEGDLFIQNVVQGDRLVALKRMPAASMERNTDEQDNFPDLSRAFLQRDVTMQSDVVYFAYWQITHIRWAHIDGERYGNSEYVQARKMARYMNLVETSQVIRRITRAPQRRHHKVGVDGQPQSPGAVDTYKESIGMGKDASKQFDPANQVNDFFTNQTVSITPLVGDEHVHEIDDMEYFQDGLTSALGTPKALYGLGAEHINRDIMDGQREEWLHEVQELSGTLGTGLKESYELALLLAGINPDSVEINLVWSESSTESPAERTNRVVAMRQATIGSGKNAVPSPLITHVRAIQLLAQDTGVVDPEAEAEDIAIELEAQADREAAAAAAAQSDPPAQDDDDEADDPTEPPKKALNDHRGERAVVACVVIQQANGQILMVRRSPGTIHEGEWECPGGHVEPGETLAQAAMREAYEETGLQVVLLPAKPVSFPLRTGGRGVMFRAVWVGGAESIALSEHDMSMWVSPTDVGVLPKLPPRFLANLRQLFKSGPQTVADLSGLMPAHLTGGKR